MEAVWVSGGSSAAAAGFIGECFLPFSWTKICLLALCCLHRAGIAASAQAVSGCCDPVIPVAHDPSQRLGYLWLTCTTTHIFQSSLMTAFVKLPLQPVDSARGGLSWGWAAC